jgi:hypothetical protein
MDRLSDLATRFTLAELVDRLADGSPRDRGLVQRVCECLELFAAFLELEGTTAHGLIDVVVTLQVRDGVSLLVTARHPDLPGEWTWKVKESEFPEVWFHRHREAVTEACVFCVLDFDVAGRRVLLPTGDPGTATARSIVGGVEHVRVRLTDGSVHTFAVADVVYRDEPADPAKPSS